MSSTSRMFCFPRSMFLCALVAAATIQWGCDEQNTGIDTYDAALEDVFFDARDAQLGPTDSELHESDTGPDAEVDATPFAWRRRQVQWQKENSASASPSPAPQRRQPEEPRWSASGSASRSSRGTSLRHGMNQHFSLFFTRRGLKGIRKRFFNIRQLKLMNRS